MSGIFLVVLAGLGVTLWWPLQGARRKARSAAGAVCSAAGVQLLDDTVVMTRLAWQRMPSVGLVVWYDFEFADTGARRHPGVIQVGPGRAVTVSSDDLPAPGEN